tara:strand:+ start:20 stop:262 length:243 start_codon:yes stop_codon:yes gene_type:complete
MTKKFNKRVHSLVETIFKEDSSFRGERNTESPKKREKRVKGHEKRIKDEMQKMADSPKDYKEKDVLDAKSFLKGGETKKA